MACAEFDCQIRTCSFGNKCAYRSFANCDIGLCGDTDIIAGMQACGHATSCDVVQGDLHMEPLSLLAGRYCSGFPNANVVHQTKTVVFIAVATRAARYLVLPTDIRFEYIHLLARACHALER